MRLNQKLTPILSGRVIQAVSQKGEVAQITFTDESIMTVKLSKPIPDNLSRTARLKVVRQGGTCLSLEFTDNSAVELELEVRLLCDAARCQRSNGVCGLNEVLHSPAFDTTDRR